MIVILTRTVSVRLRALGLVGAVALVWASAAPAQACSCPPPQGYLVWPSAGAQAVSLEPDIVVRVPLASRDGATEIRLIGPDGARVELTERRREPQNASYGCPDETVFLAPAAPLAADTRYRVEFEGSFDAGASDRTSPRSFATGSALVAAPEPTELSFHFDRLIQGPECESRATPSCPDLADVAVSQAARDDAPPTWLRISTKGIAPHDDWLVFVPGALSDAIRGSLALAASDTCVAYERIDVRGHVIAQVEECAPSSCAVLGETSWSGTDIHSCGDLPALFDGFWDAAGDDSCSAPPRISQDPSSYELIVTPAAANAGAPPSAREAAASCSVGSAGRGAANDAPIALLVVLGLIAGSSLRARRAR